MTYCHHRQCCKCLILASSVTNIILPYFLCCVSNNITGTLKTPSKTGLRRRKNLIKSKKPLPWNKPLKNGFWRATLPYPLSGSANAPWPSLGERCNALCTLLGERWPFSTNFGLLRKIRDKSPSSLELVGFESEVKATS
jgi:hypothetical protein